MKKNTPTLLLALLLAPLAAMHAAEFHVAPNGNDSNPGTITQPFATIQVGVNRLQPGDTLLVHGGVYRETITFPRSGTEQKPIMLRSYKDEKVVITGCEPVTGWTLHDAAKNIWKAPMPWTLGTGRNQVFCGDEVLIEARFPNQPSRGLEMPVSGLSKLWPTFGEFANPEPGKQPGRIVSGLLDGQPDNFWKGALYLGIHYGGWSVQTGVIESSKSGEIIVGDRGPIHWSAVHTSTADDGRGMIVGHMNALDQPGEWHWQDDVLYLIPLSGTKPDNVVAKRRQRAFDLSGREQIRVEGVSVHAGSARLQDSADCVFDRCAFEFVSHFTKAGDSTSGDIGIVVSGHDNAFLNSTIRYSAGAGIHLRGLRHTVHNCLINETDYSGHFLFSLYLEGADDFLTGGHTFTYNTLCNVGHSWYGNSPGGSRGRWRSPSLTLANLFAHNHAFNGTLLARDWGSITGRYFSGGNLNGVPGQMIYNVLHECYDPTGMRGKSSVLGIVYLDIGTCDMDIHHNLLWAAPGSLQSAFWYNTCCVNIRDRDNVFHKGFTRTSAELNPGDFPQGKPFRFGYDFTNPPPRPNWPQLNTTRIEAESATGLSGGTEKTPHGLTGLKDGDWFTFENVDLDQGWQSAVLRFASDVREMNTDKSAQKPPRHRKATDPLVLACSASASLRAEAKGYDGASPGISTYWDYCYNIADGAWLKFSQVPLGAGYRRFRVTYGNNSASPRHLEVRLDRTDGPLIGRVALPQTDIPRTALAPGQIQIYQEAVGEVSAEASGTHDVYIVFHSDDKKVVGAFDYFRFEQYRGQIPLQKNEVKIEVRAGGKDGEKLGEFNPSFTGGANVFRETVATLEPRKLAGPQTLAFVVRSATGKPIGAVDWISLEKARQTMDMTALGVEPLKRDGQYVFPEPTYRPLPPDVARLPLRLRQPLRRTFEDYALGSSERGAGVGAEDGVNSVAVTDETAASGKHSLKVTKGSGQKPSYLPYIGYSMEMDEGRLRAGFDLRIEPGAQFIYECRDAALEYKVGPRLSVDAQGWLTANNKRLLQLPHGKWVRFDLVCALGREATGTYDLTIRPSGAAPQQFDGLACPDFKKFYSSVIMSPANGPSVYYLDNVEITPEKTK